MIKVFIDEEYGYRYHCWEYPGTLDELKKDFLAGKIPPNLGYFNVALGFLGTVEQVESPSDHLWDGVPSIFDRGYVLSPHINGILEQSKEAWDAYLKSFAARLYLHGEDDTWLDYDMGKNTEELLSWPFKSNEKDFISARKKNPLPKEKP